MALVRNGPRAITTDRRLRRALTRPGVSRLVVPAMRPLARWIPASLLFEMPVSRQAGRCEILHGVDTDTAAWPMLKQLGYRPFLVTSSGLVRDDHVLGDPDYRDVNHLFVHADRVGEVAWALPAS